ncbi:hypothetical protein L4C34_10305 [Vibrio profundum]|uniref:hypothetical protein n=1 Tax=Vibrio profundum TaxID=2910247 RepID=UPI003D11DA7B
MTQRNIHGLWHMRLEGRFLYSKVTGATNKEAAQAWFDEMRQTILSSPKSDSEPWVFLDDARDWGTAPADFWETTNEVVNWMSEHNCVFIASACSKKIQSFSWEKGLNNQNIAHLFFDYDEAHQVCLDALAKAQNK